MELQIVNKEINDELIKLRFPQSGRYPTQALVCKWFRDVHKLFVMVRPSIEEDYYGQFEIDTYPMNSYKDGMKMFISNALRKDKPKLYKTHEQAEEAVILKAIEILTNKEKND